MSMKQPPRKKDKDQFEDEEWDEKEDDEERDDEEWDDEEDDEERDDEEWDDEESYQTWLNKARNEEWWS